MEKKIKKWSVYFQNPEFLERTRMFLIPRELYPLVRKWCGVRNGSKLLDVGCGTGYFTRLLTSGEEDVLSVGIDLEEPFIEYARTQADKQGLSIDFMTGDALALPFEDHTFDVVTSHTFFTSIPDPDRAMSEMKRVAKPGGIISSVTAMSFISQCIASGEYPEECTWPEELKVISQKLSRMYFTVDPLQSRMMGVKPDKMPLFFERHGLKEVSAYPVGKIFSLSNAAVPDEDKLRYIELYRISELKKLEVFMALEDHGDVTEDDAERFRSILSQKCEWLQKHLHDNNAWEWQGGANLLVTGINK